MIAEVFGAVVASDFITILGTVDEMCMTLFSCLRTGYLEAL